MVLGAVLLLIGVLLWIVAIKAGPSGRPCPRCAKSVRKGVIVCPTCGFDFNAVVPQGPTTST